MVGVVVGDDVGSSVGNADGLIVGGDDVGSSVGNADGLIVGEEVGVVVVDEVGVKLGVEVGVAEGIAVVGDKVRSYGFTLGLGVGCTGERIIR